MSSSLSHSQHQQRYSGTLPLWDPIAFQDAHKLDQSLHHSSFHQHSSLRHTSSGAVTKAVSLASQLAELLSSVEDSLIQTRTGGLTRASSQLLLKQQFFTSLDTLFHRWEDLAKDASMKRDTLLLESLPRMIAIPLDGCDSQRLLSLLQTTQASADVQHGATEDNDTRDLAVIDLFQEYCDSRRYQGLHPHFQSSALSQKHTPTQTPTQTKASLEREQRSSVIDLFLSTQSLRVIQGIDRDRDRDSHVCPTQNTVSVEIDCETWTPCPSPSNRYCTHVLDSVSTLQTRERERSILVPQSTLIPESEAFVPAVLSDETVMQTDSLSGLVDTDAGGSVDAAHSAANIMSLETESDHDERPSFSHASSSLPLSRDLRPTISLLQEVASSLSMESLFIHREHEREKETEMDGMVWRECRYRYRRVFLVLVPMWMREDLTLSINPTLLINALLDRYLSFSPLPSPSLSPSLSLSHPPLPHQEREGSGREILIQACLSLARKKEEEEEEEEEEEAAEAVQYLHRVIERIASCLLSPSTSLSPSLSQSLSEMDLFSLIILCDILPDVPTMIDHEGVEQERDGDRKSKRERKRERGRGREIAERLLEHYVLLPLSHSHSHALSLSLSLSPLQNQHWRHLDRLVYHWLQTRPLDDSLSLPSPSPPPPSSSPSLSVSLFLQRLPLSLYRHDLIQMAFHVHEILREREKARERQKDSEIDSESRRQVCYTESTFYTAVYGSHPSLSLSLSPFSLSRGQWLADSLLTLLERDFFVLAINDVNERETTRETETETESQREREGDNYVFASPYLSSSLINGENERQRERNIGSERDEERKREKEIEREIENALQTLSLFLIYGNKRQILKIQQALLAMNLSLSVSLSPPSSLSLSLSHSLSPYLFLQYFLGSYLSHPTLTSSLYDDGCCWSQDAIEMIQIVFEERINFLSRYLSIETEKERERDRERDRERVHYVRQANSRKRERQGDREKQGDQQRQKECRIVYEEDLIDDFQQQSDHEGRDGEKESEKEKERERETSGVSPLKSERKTERQTERQMERKTEAERGREEDYHSWSLPVSITLYRTHPDLAFFLMSSTESCYDLSLSHSHAHSPNDTMHFIETYSTNHASCLGLKVTLIKPSEKERYGHYHNHHHHHHHHSNDGKVFLHIEKSRDVCNTFQRELVEGIMKLKQAQVKFLEAVRPSK